MTTTQDECRVLAMRIAHSGLFAPNDHERDLIVAALNAMAIGPTGDYPSGGRVRVINTMLDEICIEVSGDQWDLARKMADDLAHENPGQRYDVMHTTLVYQAEIKPDA